MVVVYVLANNTVMLADWLPLATLVGALHRL